MKPMTMSEYLLVCLIEECAEVQHRASKALRFGLDEVQQGQLFTNTERLEAELADLIFILSELASQGIMGNADFSGIKSLNFTKYLRLSQKLGRLEPHEHAIYPMGVDFERELDEKPTDQR